MLWDFLHVSQQCNALNGLIVVKRSITQMLSMSRTSLDSLDNGLSWNYAPGMIRMTAEARTPRPNPQFFQPPQNFSTKKVKFTSRLLSSELASGQINTVNVFRIFQSILISLRSLCVGCLSSSKSGCFVSLKSRPACVVEVWKFANKLLARTQDFYGYDSLSSQATCQSQLSPSSQCYREVFK